MVWMWSSCIFSTQGDLPLLSLSWELCMTICSHNTCWTWGLYLSRQFNQAIPGTNPAAKTIHCLYHSCEEVSTFHHVNSVGIYIVSYLVVNWLYASFFPRHIASGKPNEALQSETMDRQRLSWVNLNLGMFSEVNGTSLWRTLTYHMLCVPSLVSVVEQQELSLYLWSPKRHCTSIVSVVFLLVGIEKKTWLISFFLDHGDRQLPWLLSLTMLRFLRDSEPTHLYW